MHKNPKDFYKAELLLLQQESTRLKKKSKQLSLLRFAVFVVTILLSYLLFGANFYFFSTVLVGLCLFVFLVFSYLDVQKKFHINKAKIRINKTEIAVLNRKFSHLDEGKNYVDPHHFYANDIDLFGKGSFFQYLNRTSTIYGKDKLASILTENNIDNIEAKQDAIQELAEKSKWRENFSALASLIKVENSPARILKWISNYQSKFDRKYSKAPLLFSIVSVTLLTLVSLSFISFTYVTIWFFVGLFITGRFLKLTSKVYTETDKIRDTFKQYQPLLQQIESENFTTSLLFKKQKTIQSEQKKASLIFKKFIKILDAFDQRNNIIIAVLGNGLFLTEIRNAYKTEEWLNTYKHVVKKWFEVVAFFDAYNSLGNFTFNHPLFVFPTITKENNIVKAENLGHPLLYPESRVDNNFTINTNNFFIITGANMAGKSTFLRTVSLSIVMANCGLPVCADQFNYKPIKLITSMRTVDSLSEDESYFYAELKRLKFIVEALENESYFVILDEILKGTNSKDKAIGSRQFIQKLSNTSATGIVATHDVSLCDLEKLPTIENYFFEAEINNNELYFDYKLKKGICKNMNASFLLKQLKIVD